MRDTLRLRAKASSSSATWLSALMVAISAPSDSARRSVVCNRILGGIRQMLRLRRDDAGSDPLGAGSFGHPPGGTHHGPRDRRLVDADEQPVLRRPRPGDRMAAHVGDHLGVDPVRGDPHRRVRAAPSGCPWKRSSGSPARPGPGCRPCPAAAARSVPRAADRPVRSLPPVPARCPAPSRAPWCGRCGRRRR